VAGGHAAGVQFPPPRHFDLYINLYSIPMNSKNRVYQVVAAIPKGKVLCYSDVAKLAGIKSPRWVGRYLHINEDTNLVPCHRVVSKNGMVAEKFGGGGSREHKKRLLREGVVLTGNRVDMEKCKWEA
jgi:methylated-DNA-protein-cysteine methyltransferase related protein